MQADRASKLAENTANLFNRIALADVSEILSGKDYDDWVTSQMAKFCRPIPTPVFDSCLSELKRETKGIKDEVEKSRIVLDITKKHSAAKHSKSAMALVTLVDKIWNNMPNKFSTHKEALLSDAEFQRALEKLNRHDEWKNTR